MDETQELVESALIVIKAQQRSLRTTLQILSRLAESLETMNAQPKEAQRGSNGSGSAHHIRERLGRH